MRNSGGVGTAVVIGAVIVGLVLGFVLSGNAATDRNARVFSFRGMNITLTDDFEPFPHPDETKEHIMGFLSEDIKVAVVEEYYTDHPELEEYTVEAFAAATLELDADSGLIAGDLQRKDGLLYCEHVADGNWNIMFFYQDADAFWQVFFQVSQDNEIWYRHDIFKWAGMVEFED